MRWPFGPPHLTLKPSPPIKNKKAKKNKTKKTQKIRNEKKTRKTQKYKNWAFQLSVNFFFVFGGCPKFPFLTTWPKKPTPKNKVKIGVSAKHFLKNRCASRNGHFGTKNQIQKFQLSFFVASSFLFQQQKPKMLLKPLFYSVLANQKKKKTKNNLQHRNKKQMHPFLEKGYS